MLHVGDVYSGYIYSPQKYQTYGNSINVARTLERYSGNGTLNISTQSLSFLENDEILDSHFSMGKIKTRFVKGVGMINSQNLFVKIQKILLVDDTPNVSKLLEYSVPDNNTEITNLGNCFNLMYQYYYETVVLDKMLNADSILEQIKLFRRWESENRQYTQKILRMSSIDKKEIDMYLDNIVQDVQCIT